jgi:hypothetical protein
MQQVMSIGGGMGMKITTGLFFAPNGKSPQVEGVKSDLVVHRPKEGTTYYERQMDFVIPPITIDSVLPGESPLMPHREELLNELGRRLKTRLKLTEGEEVSTQKDLAAEETYKIISDLIELTP